MERETLYSVAKHVRLQYLLHMWAIFSVPNFDHFEILMVTFCITANWQFQVDLLLFLIVIFKIGIVDNTDNFHCSVICIRTGSIVFRRGDFPVHENESMRYCCTTISSLILFKIGIFYSKNVRTVWRRHFPIKSYLVILPFVSGSLCQLKLI